MRHRCIDISAIEPALEAGETVLVPNSRTRDAVLLRLAQTGGSEVFQTPSIFAIDIWIRELWDRLGSLGRAPCAGSAILSSMEEEFIWTMLIEDSLQQYPLLNPEQTAAVVRRAYQLMKLWRVDAPDDSALQAFSAIPDVSAFLNWKRGFERLCSDSAVVNLVGATTELIALLQEGLPGPEAGLLPRRFVLFNFFNPPPLYQALFEALPMTSTASSLSAETAAPVVARRAEFVDREAEARACADWVARKCAQEPEAHIGVVCNQRSEREAQMHRALTDALTPDSLGLPATDAVHYNSAGSHQSLLDSGLVYDALLILGLARKEQQADELCRLLHSPFLAGHDSESGPRQRLEARMRERLLQRCTTDELSVLLSHEDSDYHCPLFAAALLQLRTGYRRLPKMTTARHWANFFSAALEAFGWPGSRLSQPELRLHEQWQQALEQFSSAAPVLGPMKLSTALSRLRQLLRNTPKWRDTGMLRQVSFYSVSEALGLHFDHLWLLGFDDQSWPGPVSPSPFLPYPLQKQARMPGSHAELQNQLAAEETGLLRRSVHGELVFSHPLADGEQEFRPSSLALDLEQTVFEQTLAPAINLYALDRRQDGQLETRPDSGSAPLEEFTRASGGYSLISDQSACPFRAFARYRLGVRAPEEFAEGLGARQRGTAVHLALDRLFEDIADHSQLLRLSPAERERLCRGAADAAIDYLQRRYRELMTPRFRAIESRRIIRLLMDFLDQESQREEFSVLARERQIQLDFDKLGLTFKLDRIDRLGDQRLAVIDYKTGRATSLSSGLSRERPEDMQLPVYSVAAESLQEGTVSALALAFVNSDKPGYSVLCADRSFHARLRPVSEMKGIEEDWEALRSTFGDRVTALARDFESGRHAVAPADPPGTCQYCDLQSLCRVRELLATDSDPGGEE